MFIQKMFCNIFLLQVYLSVLMKLSLGVVAILTVGLGVINSSLPTKVSANGTVLITAIQTGSAQSASEEYIELYNSGSQAIAITGWKLQYYAASPKSFDTPGRTINLSGSIPAKSSFTISSTSYMADVSSMQYSSTLASAGGHLRLMGNESSPVQYDYVGYGTATKPLVQAAPAPTAGEQLVRKKINGVYQNSGNNSLDFITSSSVQGSITSGVSLNEYDIDITELLPNPASPVSDATGEFIELHNNSNQQVQLKSLMLKSGLSFNHSFTFTNQVLDAGAYKAFYITETKLSLSNSGGSAQLVAPGNVILSQSNAYGSAKEGLVWALHDDTWEWSSTATPNQPNKITAVATTEVVPKTSTTKKSPVRKVAKSSKKSKKSTIKGASTKKAAKAKNTFKDAQPTSSLHTGVLAGVGGLAVLYGLYEYKQDIANAFTKFRSNRTNRSKNRPDA